ncbi:MAG TPA: nitrous oxide reductase accessory protein NosL [Bacteroidota bacterium]
MSHRRVRSFFSGPLPLLLFLSLSCAPGEQTLRVRYLKSECDYCRMLFQDRAFGVQMQLENDSIRVFDDPECLAAYLITNRFPGARIKRIWTVDYSSPTSLVDARSAIFIRSNNVLSPMGANIAGFGSKAEADSAFARIGGERMDWQGVVGFIRVLWFHGAKESG